MKNEKFQYNETTEEKIRQLHAAGVAYNEIQSELGMSEMTMFEYICVISKKDKAVANRNASTVVKPYASKPLHCPSCGHSPVAAILYGDPAESPELEREREAGLVYFGGVKTWPNPPRWRCSKCGQKIHLKTESLDSGLNS